MGRRNLMFRRRCGESITVTVSFCGNGQASKPETAEIELIDQLMDEAVVLEPEFQEILAKFAKLVKGRRVAGP